LGTAAFEFLHFHVPWSHTFFHHLREQLFGAVIHSLAVAGHQEEAERIFQSMEQNDSGFEVQPGVSSHDAVLLGRIRSHSWDGAIDFYEKMKKKGVSPSPQTIQGLILAQYNRGGRLSVISFVESILCRDEAPIRENSFRLISKILYKEMGNNLDDFRQEIRKLGEGHQNLRDASLDLIRSLRVAMIESNRPRTIHKSPAQMIEIQDKSWAVATSDLLKFVRALEGSKTGKS
jgi:pentatricopeptide repeat protein